MRTSLRYDEVFDAQFYSCELGVLKPAAAYFTAVLRSLDVPASTTLLVDDNADNADAARGLGLLAVLWSVDRGIEALRSELGALGLAI